MIQKRPEPPVTRRSFANIWGELDYLCKKTSYWLYSRKDKARAKRYLDRLERVLRALPENNLAIIREDALALLYELRGEIDKSIAHRRREIGLMEALHKDAQSSRYSDATRAYMLRGRDPGALEERRAILETLKKKKSEQSDALIRGSR
jgi:hypothetical protein